ncbi:VOC family protein [Kineococcus sp. R8]|uniref:VOC family protein n=1 Tax=Kineococcus siccus TaxID=2696567 RepID=UPI001411ED3A|nr:VOC family protein [Kineococcus siccus]NAZ83131.1 VOC family protein [Kineococcus siccus]
MSTRDRPWPPGVPSWADLAASDPPAAARFYGAVLGWTTLDAGPESGGYLMASVDGHAVAGIGSFGAPAWTLYIATDDADATAEAARAAGGTVLMPPGDVGASGRLAVLADPSGAPFGAWQAREHIGAGRVNEHGALAWADLRSSDPAAALAFYRQLFGWEFEPLAGEYGTVAAPDLPTPVGGLGPLFGVPASQWLVYFGVDDADAAAAAAVEAGGRVVAAPETTPFGRIGQVADLDGVVIGIVATDWSQAPDRS